MATSPGSTRSPLNVPSQGNRVACRLQFICAQRVLRLGPNYSTALRCDPAFSRLNRSCPPNRPTPTGAGTAAKTQIPLIVDGSTDGEIAPSSVRTRNRRDRSIPGDDRLGRVRLSLRYDGIRQIRIVPCSVKPTGLFGHSLRTKVQLMPLAKMPGRAIIASDGPRFRGCRTTAARIAS